MSTSVEQVSGPADAGTGVPPGRRHVGTLIASSADPHSELLRLADRLDRGARVPEPGLDLDAASLAVATVRRQGGERADKVREAEASVAAKAGADLAAPRFGSDGVTMILPRMHASTLQQALALSDAHEKARVALERRDDLSDVGRRRALAAQAETVAKEADARITEAEFQLDKHVSARRAALEKRFEMPKPPEPAPLELLQRELAVQSFLAAHRLQLSEFRLLVAQLVKAHSVYAATALRALCVRAAAEPNLIQGFSAQLQGDERAVAVERLLQNRLQLEGACEWRMIQSSLTRLQAELAGLRKNLSAALTYLHGWGADISVLKPAPGA